MGVLVVFAAVCMSCSPSKTAPDPLPSHRNPAEVTDIRKTRCGRGNTVETYFEAVVVMADGDYQYVRLTGNAAEKVAEMDRRAAIPAAGD